VVATDVTTTVTKTYQRTATTSPSAAQAGRHPVGAGVLPVHKHVAGRSRG
jgi:hypothetical protein